MPRLFALDVPLSDDFVVAVRRAWDQGDAVFPIDSRWPRAMRDRILATVRPTHLVSRDLSITEFDDGVAAEDGDALVIATSGSTGTPKGVIHTFAALEASARACHERIGLNNAHWLACLPPAHIGGFAVIARAVLLGMPLTVCPESTRDTLREAAYLGANFISLVPAMLDRIDAAWFDVVLLGGSRPPEIRPANVIATYGSTETGSGIAYDGTPLHGVQIKIGPNRELLVKGPMLMRAYRDGLTPFDSSGFLDTGDAGEIDVANHLQVFGRRSDMIISGGENVWPDAVAKALLEHRAVTNCAVFGVDDPKWGQAVCAAVVLQDDVSDDDLRNHVAEQLPRHSTPKRIIRVDALPITPGGKVDRAALTTLVS